MAVAPLFGRRRLKKSKEKSTLERSRRIQMNQQKLKLYWRTREYAKQMQMHWHRTPICSVILFCTTYSIGNKFPQLKNKIRTSPAPRFPIEKPLFFPVLLPPPPLFHGRLRGLGGEELLLFLLLLFQCSEQQTHRQLFFLPPSWPAEEERREKRTMDYLLSKQEERERG